MEVLPIDHFIPEILQRLESHSCLVVEAEPGAGKTTRLPAALLNQIQGHIFVLEPRRMAAIAAAQRVAVEHGTPLGTTIGYQVRFQNCSSPDTRIVFMTEGLLTRRMLTDPELKGVGAIVLDEFHERSLNVDLALGMSKELQDLGHPLKIIVMSATLDTKKVSDYLNGCAVVSVPGKTYPLKIHYSAKALRLRTDHEFYNDLCLNIKRAYGESNKDVLVFLPGRSEIEKSRHLLSSWAQQNKVALLALHGTLSLEQQQQVLASAPERRIILSTNVAESSVTVNGVNAVVDSGLVKVLRQDPRTGFSRLVLSKVSQASSSQRAGRAARQEAGQCYRLWTQNEQNVLSAYEQPEVLRIDVSECLLFLSAQGITDFTQFSWFEPPSSTQLQRATRDLFELGALDSKNQITALGKKMLQWPLPPRLSKLMAIAEEKQSTALAADLVALLIERDLLQSGAGEKYWGDAWECDLSLRWSLLQNWRKGQMDQDVIHSAAKVIDQFSKHLNRSKKTSANIDEIATLLLEAFPDRLCRRRGTTDRAAMSGGRGVQLSSNSVVKDSLFFIALDGVDFDGVADTQVSLACGISLHVLKTIFKDDFKTRLRTFFDNERQGFFTVKELVLNDFVIEESQPRRANAEEIQEGLLHALILRFDWLKKQNTDLGRWMERWAFFTRHTPEANNLTQDLIKKALASASFGTSSFQEVAEKDLIYHFEAQFDKPLLSSFQQQVPAKVQVPSGSWIEIHYPPDQPPFLQVRLQELFGWTSTPMVMNNKIAVVIHLLAPNFRPVQTTADLVSFWQKGYYEVRQELKIRYPKHSWPEDPLKAKPEAKGRRRF